jgi:hypothetical protein
VYLSIVKVPSVRIYCFMVLLLGGLSAQAQRHETFAVRPSKRAEKVRQARERFEREKAEARQWAKARGLKMRHIEDDRIMELMAIRNGRPIYYTTHNDKAAISTAADQVRETFPYHVNGSGVIVGVWDGALVYAAHQEFGSRITFQESGESVGSHATHVGGTIGASGVVARAEGMAPGVHIHSYYWDSDESEMAAAGAAAPGEAGKIPLSNHSYGSIAGWHSSDGSWHFYGDWSLGADPYFGQYDQWGARYWDEIVYDAPYYLPFKSAGNDRNDRPPEGATVYYYDNSSGWNSITYTNAVHAKGDGQYKSGFDTISTKGNAKNIMTVGAVSDAVSSGNRSLSAATMSSFSGWGPADDGRIKPDIVANGISLYSCDDDHTADYTTKSGTSMASPNACGSAALLIDYYDDRFPGGAMRASTLKGLIIHTADDLGRPGPDYEFGWGLMNTLEAAALIKDYADGNTLRLTESLLEFPSNTSDSYTLFSNGVEPLCVTLCWTDPPGSSTTAHDSRTPVLINDLDLRITGPGGTFHPYKLDYANPTVNATASSENNVDNVEQIYIASPEAGKYTITIDYDGSLTDNEQHYSLLISGVASDSDGDGMPDYWESTYFLSPTGGVAGVDSDGDGIDNLGEYVSGYDPNDSNSVFKVADFSAPVAGGAPFIVNWESVEGRIYNVLWSDNLIYSAFTNNNISGDLPYPAGSYTDSVERAGGQNYYRVDVRLNQ